MQEYARECNNLGASMLEKSAVIRTISKMHFIENRGTDSGVGHVKNIT